MIDRTDPNFLLSTMDANEWATEFCKRFPSMDHGTMLGWFANSIMTGYDEANRRAVPQANAELDALREIAAKLRRAGADLPAPNHKDAIFGATTNGLSIALLLVEEAIRAASKTTPSSGEGSNDQ